MSKVKHNDNKVAVTANCVSENSVDNEEQLLEDARFIGHKLGLLIGLLDIPEEIRDSFYKIAEGMNADELIEFTDVLEAHYLHSSMGFLHQQYEDELKVLKENYEKNKYRLLNTLAAKIDQITDQVINSMETVSI